MKIFVVNAGSSSLKYQLIDMENEKVLAKGLCERIGVSGAISHKTADGRAYAAETPMPTHSEAFEAVVYALTKSEAKVIDSFDEISAIGHRIVQGGSVFPNSCLVTPEVIDKIEELGALAPLHNPAHVLAIRACIKTFGDKIPQVVVFDTSFHQTMPPKAYMYPLPYEYYEKYGVRKYGAHGTSHRFVSDRVAALENKPKKDIKIITCHLGNGCSITAVKDGVCADTSMGFTPLDGFMMGTRSGTLDPSALTYIAEKEHLSPEDVNTVCNKKSGMLGISGVSNDNRDICAAAEAGNKRAQLAIEMQRYEILKFVGSYIAAMNGVDAIAFTGGIGENDPDLRKYVCDNLTFVGVDIDEDKNKLRGEEVKISTPKSRVNVYVIPTNEELAIARDTLAIISK
ncbi:MAG TPA: acetate kinase [Ruminococcaceae bacterium]|nr:acetate kinase [Oscillospiraceae bacterium]HCD80728.1 acetate kinase [Oscillospiraceae bacterium]